jgi:deoxyribodipyrimidine photolyase
VFLSLSLYLSLSLCFDVLTVFVLIDNPHYDSLDGCYDWAKETLNVHRNDPRAKVYSREKLERAETHDDLWNAAQLQMVQEGKMHVSDSLHYVRKFKFLIVSFLYRDSCVCIGQRRSW